MASSKRGPVIILSMLIVMLLLSIGAIALIVYFNSNRPTAAELTAACQDKVGSAIATEYGQMIDACKAEANATKSFPGTDTSSIGDVVGFQYPNTWEVATTVDAKGNREIDISDSYLNLAQFNAGENIFPVTIRTFPLDANALQNAGSFENFIKSLYSSDTTAQEKMLLLNNQQVVDVQSTNQTGVPESGPSENIYFAGKDTYILITFTGVGNAAEESGWEIIKNSLDFSAIK